MTVRTIPIAVSYDDVLVLPRVLSELRGSFLVSEPLPRARSSSDRRIRRGRSRLSICAMKGSGQRELGLPRLLRGAKCLRQRRAIRVGRICRRLGSTIGRVDNSLWQSDRLTMAIAPVVPLGSFDAFLVAGT